MLSAKLVGLIKAHSEDITASVVRMIRENPEMSNIARLPDDDLFETWNHRLSHLERWLSPLEHGKLSRDQEEIAKVRFQQGIPLHEMVYAFHLLRNQTIAYVRDLAPDVNYLEVYAEGELERWLANFFDFLVYHTVRGYEHAYYEQRSVTK